MAKTTKTLSVIAVALLLSCGGVLAAEDIENGKKLYAEECASCHGDYGEVSNEVVPNILGQYPGYMLTQMAAFLSDDPKTSRRGIAGSLKRSILIGLSVQDIKDIVAYLGTIKYRVDRKSVV